MSKIVNFSAKQHEAEQQIISDRLDRLVDQMMLNREVITPASDKVSLKPSSKHPNDTFKKFDAEETMKKLWKLRKK